ncbi:MAG: hypothetical protein ACO1SX_15380 [Actinomycetota bacterium]
MTRLSLFTSTALLVTALATAAAVAQEPPVVGPPAPGTLNRTVLLGRPLLQVLRKHGQPSRVRTMERVPITGGKPTTAILWIYERPGGATLEFLIGGDGKIIQTTTRSKELDLFRIEPKP